ncbi:MAG: IS66 family transposase [Nanoarchaeota archaeon]|nr:IS66 family transposase [Nanoarchaeota archaeon]MBU1597586.1 IS66 family transposase [Nanoarchaeota archaeon]MBU2441220.1 IS66 family transposase [Nanoarchaeota archaeon]
MNEVEELKALVKKLMKRIDELEKENLLLKRRVAELESKQKTKEVPSFVKPDKKTKSHNLGRPKGYEGVARPLPDHFDEEINHKINKCPDCGTKVGKELGRRTRYVEDIIPKQNYKVTKHTIPKHWCPNCKKIVEPKPEGVIPNFRFGLNLMLFVCFQSFGLALTNNKIQLELLTYFGIKVSLGEISHIITKTGKLFSPKFKELKQKIRETTYHQEDETGWRKKGKNHWLWAFISEEITLFKIAKSRGHKVPKGIIGKGYNGTISSDRFSAYNKLEEETNCTLQKCWVHILRESKKLAKSHNEGKYIHRKLKEIFTEAKEYENKQQFEKVPELIAKVKKIAARRYKHSEARKFINSLAVRHKYNLFRFVGNEHIKADNNIVERAIRKAVIIRKISGGNRSHAGAVATERMLSFVQTCQLQNKDFFQEGKNYLSELFNLRN